MKKYVCDKCKEEFNYEINNISVECFDWDFDLCEKCEEEFNEKMESIKREFDNRDY